MKKLLLVTIPLLLVYSLNGFGQNNHNIKFATSQAEQSQNCKRCWQVFQQKPKEVSFSVKREGLNLYFETNDKNWFNRLFLNPNDGIAVDIVDKDRYACGNTSIENTQIRGLLLAPVFSDRLKKTLKSQGNDRFRVLVGKLPTGLKDEDLEYNILFISNNYLCHYYTIYNLQAYDWDLLDMGMYLDSINYKTTNLKPNGEDKFKMRYKNLKFIIPFEKNKSQYVPQDIKPLYDSLNLTDFNIKKINIKAYSSIEGSVARNIELQEQRAQSIAQALQTYQKPTMETEISTSENWVEFLNDIDGTNYESLKSQSKTQLKEKLTGSFANEMEPILKNHRKAVITLELDRKDSYREMTEDQLINSFNNSVTESKLDEAQKILNTIFYKLRYTETSPDLLNKLKVPKQKNLSYLLNDLSAFKYQLDERNLIIVRDELEEVEKLDPKNFKVKYNLAALKFKIWRHNVEPVNADKFKTEITNLKNHGIAKPLVERMLINYNIIKAEEYMRKRDYDKKDGAVDFIFNNYKNLNLSDRDAMSLSQFLTYYANVTKAASVLERKATEIDVDEDLLFYYLNLTLTNKDLTQTDEYRAVMLNAVNLNKNRFCKLFNPVEKDGVTFQLMEDDYLRSSYCENCVE